MGQPGEFWELLSEGRDAISEIPEDRWIPDLIHDPAGAAGKIRSWRGGFLPTATLEAFDWRAHRLLPREARHMDPQQRLLLELAWESLDDAGLSHETARDLRTGVFVGIQWNDFFRLLARDSSRLDGYSVTGNAFHFAANRISYAFDLRGPSLSLDCGCASGLVALQNACQSLWMGDCELALAGAVELILSPDSSIAMTATGMLSKQGRCRPFDARADGFVRGEGAGLVVLKPVSKLTASDRPYAIVRGIAAAHNGHNEWIMASSAKAQEGVIREACRKAGIEPHELDYAELHSTGHPKGDAIEIETVARTVAGGGRRPCLIGSVKANFGHLGAASGMASLIKVALALHQRKIPPTPGPQEPHPGRPMEELGIAVPRLLREWPAASASPTAGVTALSLGGVSAHAVLSAAPEPARPSAAERRPRLLPLSARSPEALRALAGAHAELLRRGEVLLADVGFTASVGRSHHEHRLAAVGASRQEMAAALEAALRDGEGSEPSRRGLDEPKELATLGRAYERGHAVDWRALDPGDGRVTSLPTYPWQRERLWPEGLDARRVSTPPEARFLGRIPRQGYEDRKGRAIDWLRGSLDQGPATEQRPRILAYIREQAARVLGIDAAEVADGRPLQELGLDSLTASELNHRLELDLGLSSPIADLFAARSAAGITDYLVAQLERRTLLSAMTTENDESAEADDSVEILVL